MFARSRRSSDGDRLPQGAEAALWSIVEVIPDPRNHLALTRDPTCEIRLSAAQIEAAAAAPVPAAAASASPRPTAEPTVPTARPTPVESVAPASAVVRPPDNGVRWSADTAEVRLPGLATVIGPDTRRPETVDLSDGARRTQADPVGEPSEEDLIRALFAESA